MELKFSESEVAFQQELRDFMDAELPPGYEPLEWDEGWESPETWRTAKVLAKKMADRGLLAVGFPVEYGGRGATFIEQTIFQEETTYRGIPGFSLAGAGMLGPTLLQFGTEDQKRKHILSIARGETTWAQLYSEPNAGSDLASLQTRVFQAGTHGENGTGLFSFKGCEPKVNHGFHYPIWPNWAL